MYQELYEESCRKKDDVYVTTWISHLSYWIF